MTNDDDKNGLPRRKILGSIGAIGAAGAVSGYGTLSAFSDDEEVDASFTAGELDLLIDAKVPTGAISGAFLPSGMGTFDGYQPEVINGDAGAGVSLELGDFKPGDWVLICYDLTVMDNPACLGMKTDHGASDENGITEPEAEAGDTSDSMGEGELADHLEVTVYDDFDETATIDNDLSAAEAALSNELQGTQTLQSLWDMFSGGESIADESTGEDFYFLLELPFETGNMVQSDSVQWDLVFNAIQSRHTDEDPYGGTCEPVWGEDPQGGDCTPTCPDSNIPSGVGGDFPVSVEGVDSSNFPTIEATARVETQAGGDGPDGTIRDPSFLVDEVSGGSTCGQTISDVRFGDAQDQTEADVMIVLDNSGSMDGRTAGEKLQEAVNGAFTLIGGDEDISNGPDAGGLDSTVNVGAVRFGNGADLLRGLTTDHSSVESAIDSLSETSDGTDMDEGIIEAQAELDANGDSTTPSYMIVLANGNESYGSDSRAAAKNARNVTDLNSQGDKTTIVSIAYGTGANIELMEDISSPPKVDDGTIDGDDVNAFKGGTDDISTVFDDIGSIISGTWTIEYETTQCEEDGSDRTVEVYVDDPNEGEATGTGGYTAPSS